MTTPQQILENVRVKQLHIARLWVALHLAEDELLSETQRYLDALHSQHLTTQGAAAVEAAEAIVSGASR